MASSYTPRNRRNRNRISARAAAFFPFRFTRDSTSRSDRIRPLDSRIGELSAAFWFFFENRVEGQNPRRYFQPVCNSGRHGNTLTTKAVTRRTMHARIRPRATAATDTDAASASRYTALVDRIQLQQSQTVRRFVTELAIFAAKNATARRTSK